jgi:hypothetical protein
VATKNRSLNDFSIKVYRRKKKMEMKITNGCYEYVHLSIKTYDELNETINRLSKLYGNEKESKKEIEDKVTELTCQLEVFKEEILNKYLLDYRVRDYQLEDVTNISEWNYGLDNSNYLLKMGFTIQEMNEFITKKWEEFHPIKEEEENE